MRSGWFAIAAIVTFAAASVASAQSQAEMNDKEARDYRKADQTMNELYQRLLKAYDPQSKALLIQAQRAWIAFRDADCKLATHASGQGSVFPMLQANCLAGITNQRIKDLRYLATCQEGDLTCPVVLPKRK
jgi:uncharacterized protein YecT (DUF1311 family)